MVLMYDAITAPQVPLNPAKMPKLGTVAVASYCDGDFASGWSNCMARFPTLAAIGWVVSIATRITTIARVMDIEPGNPVHAAQAPGWVRNMLAHKVYLPTLYADEADMPGVKAAMNASGIPRSEYGLWVANPTGVIHADAGYEATQSPFEGNFDVSDCVERFLPPLPAPKPAARKPNAQGLVRVEGTLHVPSGQWDWKPLSGDVTWGTEEKDWCCVVGVGNTSGHWKHKPTKYNAV